MTPDDEKLCHYLDVLRTDATMRAATRIRELSGQLEAAEQHVKILREQADECGVWHERKDREIERLRAALEPLAGIPLEEFLPKKAETPLMGWNNHDILVSHVLEARAVLAQLERGNPADGGTSDDA